jgi:hypothetical protein
MRRIDEVFDKLPPFVAEIVQNLPNASGGSRPAQATSDISIEVSTKVAGTLFFQNEEIAELWGNDTHTIPIERPGTYTVKLGLPNKMKLVRTVEVTTRGITKVNFNNSNISIGDEGPGGGTIFFAEGGKYMECSGELGNYNWRDAIDRARNYRGGDYTDWRLPNKNELYFMYQNLHKKGLGGFSQDAYWSSSQNGSNYAWYQRFKDGIQSDGSQTFADSSGLRQRLLVRAVRAF